MDKQRLLALIGILCLLLGGVFLVYIGQVVLPNHYAYDAGLVSLCLGAMGMLVVVALAMRARRQAQPETPQEIAARRQNGLAALRDLEAGRK